MAAQFAQFGAGELAGCCLLNAVLQLVVERVEQDLNKRVRVLAVQVILAVDPTPVLVDRGTPFRVIEVRGRRPSRVLLAVSMLALTPLMFQVD